MHQCRLIYFKLPFFVVVSLSFVLCARSWLRSSIQRGDDEEFRESNKLWVIN